MSFTLQPRVSSVSSSVLRENESATVVWLSGTPNFGVSNVVLSFDNSKVAVTLTSIVPSSYTATATDNTVGTQTVRTYRFGQFVFLTNPTFNFLVTKVDGASGSTTIGIAHRQLDTAGSILDSAASQVSFSLINAQGQGGPPTPPLIINASPSSPTAVNVTFNSSPMATSTTVTIRTPQGAFVTSTTHNGTGNNIVLNVSGLTLGTSYRAVAGSNNQYGSSSSSNEVSFTTLGLPEVPSAVSNLTASPNSATQINLAWTAAITEMSGTQAFPNTYTIKRSLVSGGPYTTIGTTTGTSWANTGLAFNTTYYYVIQTSNAAGSGATTAEVSATTFRSPNIPRDFTSFTAVVSDYTNVTLTAVYPGGTLSQKVIFSRSDVSAAGPFDPISTQGGSGSAKTFTYVDTGLDPNTQYWYTAVATNSYGSNTTEDETVTTSVAPANPGAPSALTGTALDDGRVQLNWTRNAPLTEFSFDIERSVTGGGVGFSVIGSAPAESVSFTDTGLAPNATYFYRVRAMGYAGNSAYTSEVEIRTLPKIISIAPQCPFYLTSGYVGKSVQIANKKIFPSNLDRAIVHCGGRWYLEGLKPQLVAPVIAKDEAGGSMGAGTYFVYVVLFDSVRQIRSLPGPASNQVIITGSTGKITVQPQLEAGDANVKVRDIAYEPDLTQIFAADFWEIYLATTNVGTAYCVAQLPIETVDWENAVGSETYTIDTGLTRQMFTDGNLRPLEQNLENSLPPACSFRGVKRNRIVAFGETPIVPTAADQAAGASLAIAAFGHTATLSNFTVGDEVIYKQVYISDGGALKPTGWEVWDREGSTLYIRHADQAINTSGFQGAGGNFPAFCFAPDQSRVYFSAWYSGEALRRPTFNPEGYPPFTYYNYEFFPEDNTDPCGIIEVGDALLLGKPSKWLYLQGGDEIDFPTITVTPISESSGLNNFRTLAKNRNDIAYFLGDSGLHRVTSSGVEKVVDFTGNAHMFQKKFTLESINAAVAAWFAREDYYVCFALDEIGNSGNRDGFIYDEKNNAMYWFSCDRQITACVEVKNNLGQYQLVVGDESGNIGIFLKRQLSADGVDYNQANPLAASTPISGYCYSGLIDTGQSFTIQWFQPRIQSIPANLSIDGSFVVYGKNRMDDPNNYGQPDIRIPFSTTDVGSKYRVGGNRFQQAIVGYEFTMPQDSSGAEIQFKSIPMRADEHGAS